MAALVPYARNARTHSEDQVAQIAASIKEWGWTTPVLVDEAGGSFFYLAASAALMLTQWSVGMIQNRFFSHCGSSR